MEAKTEIYFLRETKMMKGLLIIQTSPNTSNVLVATKDDIAPNNQILQNLNEF